MVRPQEGKSQIKEWCTVGGSPALGVRFFGAWVLLDKAHEYVSRLLGLSFPEYSDTTVQLPPLQRSPT